MIFLVLLLIILLSVVNTVSQVKQQKLPSTSDAVVVEDVPKFCPPHKWFYQEVKDTDGKTVRWRIVCELCGPMKPSDGPARMG